MLMLTRERVESIRQQYPKGSRILLNQMADDPRPVPPGSEGVVDLVDDAGQNHAIWPGGRHLAVIPGVDDFQKIPFKTPKKEMPKHRGNVRE